MSVIYNNMKLIDIFESSPFGNVVSITRPDDIATIKRLYSWVQQAVGIHAPPPTVMVADHEKMQWAAQRAQHYTQINGMILGWFSTQHGDTIFISSQLNISRSKGAQAVLVHEMVHYLQNAAVESGEREAFTSDDVDALEQEADEIMHRYVSGG